MARISTRERLKQELQHIPDELLGELHEYMKYLQYKKRNKSSSMDTAYASEVVLGKDWNSSEEEQAWQDL